MNCSFRNRAISSSSNDSSSMTWHQWQVEYPMLTSTGRFRSLACANASSPQGYQSTGLCACWSRYGLVSRKSRFVYFARPSGRRCLVLGRYPSPLVFLACSNRSTSPGSSPETHGNAMYMVRSSKGPPVLVGRRNIPAGTTVGNGDDGYSRDHGKRRHLPLRCLFAAIRFFSRGGKVCIHHGVAYACAGRKEMAIVFVTVAPLGTATTSLSRYVAGVERILRESGLTHQLTAMGTIIEGDLDAILPVVRRMHEAPFAEGALRVSTLIKVDDRRDKDHTIEGKVRSVREKLGE